MFTPSPHVRALIFDCDGTLADTMPLHWKAWVEALAHFGITVNVREMLEPMSGATVETIATAVAQATGMPLDLAQFVPMKQMCFRAHLAEVKEIPCVADIARRYRGELGLAVVSGGCRANVEGTLRTIGLSDLFPVILTGDDPFPGKPAPDLFLEAARRLGVAPETCVVFEDGDYGLTAARAAGMTPVDVRPWTNVLHTPPNPDPLA